jgi:hypothetical protein
MSISAIRASMRVLISSRSERTASTPLPAGSSRAQWHHPPVQDVVPARPLRTGRLLAQLLLLQHGAQPQHRLPGCRQRDRQQHEAGVTARRPGSARPLLAPLGRADVAAGSLGTARLRGQRLIRSRRWEPCSIPTNTDPCPAGLDLSRSVALRGHVTADRAPGASRHTPRPAPGAYGPVSLPRPRRR